MDQQENAEQTSILQEDAGPTARPRLLFWLVIGLFLLAIVGSVTSIFVFRNVLPPGQQQRVIKILPFMEYLLPPRLGPRDTLPTALPAPNGGISPEDLLKATFSIPTTQATESSITPTPPTT